MKLEKARIKNFRSIKDLEIIFSSNCRVLVGINETGKSNILKAISHLSPEFKPSKLDKREFLPEESRDQESEIIFFFKPSKEESEEIYQKLISRVLTDKSTSTILSNKEASIPFRDLINKSISTIQYIVDIGEEFVEKEGWLYEYWQNLGWDISSEWRRPNQNCPSDLQIPSQNGTHSLQNFTLVHEACLPEEALINYVDEASLEDLAAEVEICISKVFWKHLPEVVLWRFEDQNLLPTKININEFTRNPKICLPLKYMFSLAGMKEDQIKEKITEARNGSRNTFKNLLKGVSQKNTKHFQAVWKEYKNIEFELTENGDFLEIFIKEQNSYEFANRSDGFKRFATFLLMISAKVKTGQLKDSILLIDEPEISLHPSGARYLRDELIQISKDNLVIYSTHSIFMIDKENIGRHVILKKENEETTIQDAREGNIVDEEVLSKALGYSFFENLKKQVLLFEGWKDKKLFKVAMTKVPSSFSEVKVLKEYGLSHSEGVKHIKNVVPMLEIARRECYIISDCDEMAKEHQIHFHRDQIYGSWWRYDEIQDNCQAFTGEDFIDVSAFKKPIDHVSQILGINPISENDLNGANGKIYALKQWLRNNKVTDKALIKQYVDQIKENVFNNLRAVEIKREYYQFLVSLKHKIEAKQSSHISN